jgi:hypothetical protein
MTIFAFGFILGAVTVTLIWGLLFLAREKTATRKLAGFVNKSGQGVPCAEIFPELSLLKKQKSLGGVFSPTEN